MDYGLRVDMEAIVVLDSIPRRARSRLMERFAQLRVTPDQYSDCHQYDKVGRRIEICIFADFSIHYWIDFADRQVKVLAIRSADR